MFLKQKQLTFFKTFLGSLSRKWNPQNEPFISGIRYRVFFVDITYSNFHLRKFLLLLKYCSMKRLNTIFVLRKQYSNLYPIFNPFASYAPFWVGGVISNFKSVRQHFQNKGYSSFMPRYPDLAILLNELSYMDFAINEAFNTRTPAISFGDSSTNLQQSVYGVGGKITDLGAASFITRICLTVIKHGYLKQKLQYKQLLRRCILRAIHKQINPSNYTMFYVQFHKNKVLQTITSLDDKIIFKENGYRQFSKKSYLTFLCFVQGLRTDIFPFYKWLFKMNLNSLETIPEVKRKEKIKWVYYMSILWKSFELIKEKK